MKERKIQLTGGSTYTVSLPKEWATEMGLETGDPLRLYPQDRRLIIEPSRQNEEARETTVAVGGYSERKVRRMVLAFYTSGYNTITVTAADGLGGNRRAIATTARNLIGLEIIESGERRMKLKNLLDSTSVSAAQSTAQIQQVTLSMHEDAITALLKQDPSLAEHVVKRDDQVDRLYAMVSRQFQRSLKHLGNAAELEDGRMKLYDYQTTARQFERVADHAVKITDLTTRFDEPVPAEFAHRIKRIADRSRTILTQAATPLIDDGETELAHDALDRRNEVLAEISEVEQDLHSQEIEASHLIALTLDSLTRTAEYGGNIAEHSLNATARGEQLSGGYQGH